VSFSNATLVFEIGEEVKETSSSGFLATVATLHTQLLEDGSMLQVRFLLRGNMDEGRVGGGAVGGRGSKRSSQIIVFGS
jgi:hypothetical protein